MKYLVFNNLEHKLDNSVPNDIYIAEGRGAFSVPLPLYNLMMDTAENKGDLDCFTYLERFNEGDLLVVAPKDIRNLIHDVEMLGISVLEGPFVQKKDIKNALNNKAGDYVLAKDYNATQAGIYLNFLKDALKISGKCDFAINIKDKNVIAENSIADMMLDQILEDAFYRPGTTNISNYVFEKE